MILLRLEGLKGKYCDITGGQTRYRYGESDSGWFPIESMNFGFQTLTETSADKTSSSSQTGSASASQGASPRAPKAPPARGGKGGDESFTTIQVSKFVDGATTSLMRFAMEDRKVTKADEKKLRKADFHFLHSVRGKASDAKEARFIFPYLMITLENVLIKGWNITASGDERPTESIELWYDKAAMRYYRTKDGLHWVGGDVSGWDQSKNEEWTPPDKGTYFEQPDTTK